MANFGGIPAEDDEKEEGINFGGVLAESAEPTTLETPEPVLSEQAPERSFTDMLGDLGTSYGIGSNALLKLGGDLYGLTTGDMDNWASSQGARGIEFFNDKKTETLKQLEAGRQLKIDNTDNEFAKAGHAFWETVSSPSLLAAFVFEQAPMLVATMGSGAVAGTGAKVLGATASTVSKASVGGALAAGGAMQGADSGTEAYEKLTNLPDEVWAVNDEFKEEIAKGTDPDLAKHNIALELAQDTAIGAGIVSVGLNMIPGASKLEKFLVGAKQSGVGRMKGFATGFLGEATAEGLEEGFGVLRANIATQKVDPTQELTAGTGEALGMGAAAGIFGGAAGLQTSDTKSNREIIDDLKTSGDAIQAAPTVDAALETASAIVGAEVESHLGTQEARAAAEAEALRDPVAEAALEPSMGKILDPNAQSFIRSVTDPTVEPTVEPTISSIPDPITEAAAEPIISSIPDPITEAKVEPAISSALDPIAKEPNDFGGVAAEAEVETAPAIAPEPEQKPLTEGERIAAEMDIQAKARLKTEEERVKRERSAPKEAVISSLTLSKDVPQFKEGTDEKGVVEPLGGTFDPVGVGPIQVWVRKNGDQEVITGRHRLDLAKRSGLTTIPAQFHYEAEGFGVKEAKALDATLNIREGQGQVKDYINFIKESGMTEAEADAQGILARSTGKQAFGIAQSGSELLIDAHAQGIISDGAASKISEAAPNNEALQVVGLKAIEQGKPVGVAVNMVKAVSTMAPNETPQEGDLFGFDTGAIEQAESMAKAAARKQAELQRRISAVQGAAKRPELAKGEGVNVKDPASLTKRVEQLKAEKSDWDNWHTSPELTGMLKREIEGETAQPVQEPVLEPAPALEPREVVEHSVSVEAAQTFNTARDAVDWVQNNAQDPVFKAIASQIRDSIGTDVKFKLKGDGTFNGGTRRGVYQFMQNRMTGEKLNKELAIYDQGLQEGTLTHELVHVATQEAIANPKTPQQVQAKGDMVGVKKDIDSLIKTDPQQFSKLTRPEQMSFASVGNSLDEFVTYTLTNKHYQSALKKLHFKGEKVSIFSKLAENIKSLLGVTNVETSAFARALEATSAVVEASQETAQQEAVTTAAAVEPKTRGQKSIETAGKLRREAYNTILRPGETFTHEAYEVFMKQMRAEYARENAAKPKETIQGRADFTQFIQKKVGLKVSLSDIKLTRKITDKDGNITVAQGKADVILRQTRKKRDVALKLLRCVQ
tara:strand:+ start:45680 stop:49357 length:3678 start_codon:yes stop_codon:yes gene_type:complete